MEGEGTEAVLGFLGDMRVGFKVSSGRVGVNEGMDVEEAPGSEGEEGRPGPP